MGVKRPEGFSGPPRLEMIHQQMANAVNSVANQNNNQPQAQAPAQAPAQNNANAQQLASPQQSLQSLVNRSGTGPQGPQGQ